MLIRLIMFRIILLKSGHLIEHCFFLILLVSQRIMLCKQIEYIALPISISVLMFFCIEYFYIVTLNSLCTLFVMAINNK